MIQVGEVLDKYELLERVGQGGMAVVYRGIDRQLKRVVAIKVLHKHLSDYQEARDRFEREAQAVAKLRHENILEIFDYSGADDAEAAGASYIVTEFIDGQTLKQFVTDRPITYPEIGAMIVLQVCRALAHAHGAGILHRDVKPENIMVRGDGVVKLMDFGISHMVDLERLTVTGQLLGSPAYMAPEHVEGRPLDYRTDVFAAGIVLYQLTVGKLPFEGKNPHEVLKRIAECRFVDPRQANPRIGNRLGKVILRAMAALPADRFPSITEMVLALEGYLEESGIPVDKIASELGRYFQAPAAYEQALKERLVDHLTRRGQKQLADDDRAAALDVFDRVLTIDPQNAKVLTILDGINRKRQVKTGIVGVAFALVLGFCAWMIHKNAQPPAEDAPPALAVRDKPVRHVPQTHVVHETVPPEQVDAAVAIAEPDASAGSAAHAPLIDGGVVVAKRTIRVTVTPSEGSQVQFGDGQWLAIPSSGVLERDVDHEIVIKVQNPACCLPDEHTTQAGETDVAFSLKFLPATVKPTCKDPTVSVTVDGTPGTLDKGTPLFFAGSLMDEKEIKVEFIHKDRVETRTVKVKPGQMLEVPCDTP